MGPFRVLSFDGTEQVLFNKEQKITWKKIAHCQRVIISIFTEQERNYLVHNTLSFSFRKDTNGFSTKSRTNYEKKLGDLSHICVNVWGSKCGESMKKYIEVYWRIKANSADTRWRIAMTTNKALRTIRYRTIILLYSNRKISINAYGLKWHVTHLEFCRLFSTSGSDSHLSFFFGKLGWRHHPRLIWTKRSKGRRGTGKEYCFDQ